MRLLKKCILSCVGLALFPILGIASIFRPIQREKGSTTLPGGRFTAALVGPFYGLWLALRLPFLPIDPSWELFKEETKAVFTARPFTRDVALGPSEQSLSLLPAFLLTIGATLESLLLLVPALVAMIFLLGVKTSESWGEAVPGLGHILGALVGTLVALTTLPALLTTPVANKWHVSRNLEPQVAGSALKALFKEIHRRLSRVSIEPIHMLLLPASLSALFAFPLAHFFHGLFMSAPDGRFSRRLLLPLVGLWNALSLPAAFLLAPDIDFVTFMDNLKRPHFFSHGHAEFVPTKGAARNYYYSYSQRQSLAPAIWLTLGASVEGCVFLPFMLVPSTFAGGIGLARAWGSRLPFFGHIAGGVAGCLWGLLKAMRFPLDNATTTWRYHREKIQLSCTVGDTDAEIEKNRMLQELDEHNQLGIHYRKCRTAQTVVTAAFAQKQYPDLYAKKLEEKTDKPFERQCFDRKYCPNARQALLSLWNHHKSTRQVAPSHEASVSASRRQSSFIPIV